MTAHEPYDQERVVRQHEIHHQPTEPIPNPPPGYGPEYVDPVPYETDVVSEDITRDWVLARRAILQRIANIIWFVAGLILAAIGLRVAFKLLEANASTDFVSFIYGFTDPFVRPFEGIFEDPTFDGSILDTAALTAIVIYLLLTWALVRFLWLVFDPPPTGASRSIRRRHHDHV